jgi:hypothetical protein
LLIFVMLVRPFVSRVCLFFVVSLPACDFDWKETAIFLETSINT